MNLLSFLFGRYVWIAFRVLSVKEAENRWNEEQRCYSGTQQATDDRSAERCVLLASVTQTQGHRNHANNHGQGGHDYRAKSRISRLYRRFHWISVMKQLFLRERNHEDAVGRCYSHAHDCAHQRGDA